MKKNNNKRFNGLKDEILMQLTNFMLIYETNISKGSKTIDNLKNIYPKTFTFFEENLDKKTIKKKPRPDKLYLKGDECKMFLFCKHLRNSFAHGLLKQEKGQIHIRDLGKKGTVSADGYVDDKIINDFLDVVIAEYDEKTQALYSSKVK